ncbi:MAG: phosphoadenosine phosphosulfate reductase family protein [Nitrospirae bacterium]|nr:phosphoadenosine phosphosulfate reductase family protein [Nitrospirota bacterium]
MIKEELKRMAHGKNAVLLYTGDAGSALLLDAAEGLNIKAVFIDTGYHFSYTLNLVESFGERIEIISAANVAAIPEGGMDECCRLRKTEALNDYLEKTGAGALIVPFRDEESYTEIEDSFLKGVWESIEIIRPLSSMHEKDLWTEIKERGIRFSNLYRKGYRFIDCACCVSRFRRRSGGAPKEAAQMDDETVEKLKALGYM